MEYMAYSEHVGSQKRKDGEKWKDLLQKAKKKKWRDIHFKEYRTVWQLKTLKFALNVARNLLLTAIGDGCGAIRFTPSPSAGHIAQVAEKLR